ncbi:hypothetical protein [Jeotgalibacillus terrae]|uniref:YcxB-like protein domain-containing protein n=1 Tax=Jeotgalibacillus terrae TaxID=587735 RepID=A0ABW5ZCY6_9BACL|nr:hypothetical protein [Jeotgalibacillus terrae]MBM7579039.1 hypothetical protein [Jeotgalibacillus terrae]
MITRKIEWEEQHIIEHESFLHLYPQKLTDDSNEFYFHEILDLSYKESMRSFGLLYVHTTKGLFPYKVRENPISFIRIVEEKIKEMKG